MNNEQIIIKELKKYDIVEKGQRLLIDEAYIAGNILRKISIKTPISVGKEKEILKKGEIAQDKLTVKELIDAKELIEKAKVRIDFVIDRHEKPKATSQLQPSDEVIAEGVVMMNSLGNKFVAIIEGNKLNDQYIRVLNQDKLKGYMPGTKVKILIHKCKESK